MKCSYINILWCVFLLWHKVFNFFQAGIVKWRCKTDYSLHWIIIWLCRFSVFSYSMGFLMHILAGSPFSLNQPSLTCLLVVPRAALCSLLWWVALPILMTLGQVRYSFMHDPSWETVVTHLLMIISVCTACFKNWFCPWWLVYVKEVEIKLPLFWGCLQFIGHAISHSSSLAALHLKWSAVLTQWGL